jgi:hypothetical protein
MKCVKLETNVIKIIKYYYINIIAMLIKLNNY